jgi:predicted nucleic acid-binding protein
MNARFLLDKNMFIYIRRERPAAVQARFQRQANFTVPFVPSSKPQAA